MALSCAVPPRSPDLSFVHFLNAHKADRELAFKIGCDGKSGAEAGLVKGYSRDLDSARLAGIFHCLAAALEANVWFEYVASKANLADLPSRDDFELLRSPEFRAEWFELEWPELAAWDGELSGLFESLRKRSRGRKRARGE